LLELYADANESPMAQFMPDALRALKQTARLHGRNAEMRNAFVFGKRDAGDMRWSGRLGRHSLLWGDILFFGANAIAGGMMPVDVVKLADPNATRDAAACKCRSSPFIGRCCRAWI